MNNDVLERIEALEKRHSSLSAASLAALRKSGERLEKMDAQLFVARNIIEVIIKSHPAPDLLGEHLQAYFSFASSQLSLDKAQRKGEWDNPYAAIWQQAVQDELAHWSAVVSDKTTER